MCLYDDVLRCFRSLFERHFVGCFEFDVVRWGVPVALKWWRCGDSVNMGNRSLGIVDPVRPKTTILIITGYPQAPCALMALASGM